MGERTIAYMGHSSISKCVYKVLMIPLKGTYFSIYANEYWLPQDVAMPGGEGEGVLPMLSSVGMLGDFDFLFQILTKKTIFNDIVT
jgi:hypothetical protein